MIDWPAIITALSLLLGALGVKEFVTGLNKKRTGEAQDEKSESQKLFRENARKEVLIEHLRSNLRKQKEYSSLLRRLLVENGVPYAMVPDWPKESSD